MPDERPITRETPRLARQGGGVGPVGGPGVIAPTKRVRSFSRAGTLDSGLAVVFQALNGGKIRRRERRFSVPPKHSREPWWSENGHAVAKMPVREGTSRELNIRWPRGCGGSSPPAPWREVGRDPRQPGQKFITNCVCGSPHAAVPRSSPGAPPRLDRSHRGIPKLVHVAPLLAATCLAGFALLQLLFSIGTW